MTLCPCVVTGEPPYVSASLWYGTSDECGCHRTELSG